MHSFKEEINAKQMCLTCRKHAFLFIVRIYPEENVKMFWFKSFIRVSYIVKNQNITIQNQL